MRIFAAGEKWHSKNNFVDENNVFLGYDEYDDCCSDGGWFVSDKQDEWLKETFKEESLEFHGFVFDTNYFRMFSSPEHDCDDNAAQFRITNGKKEKFITLYNLHNGYYGKGFEFKVGNKVVREGAL